MKKIIICILIILISLACYAKSKHTGKIKFLKSRCIMGYLYYDWVGREKFDSIPVLDKAGKMIKCEDECEK